MARQTNATAEAMRNISKTAGCPHCLARPQIWRGRIRIFHEGLCQTWERLTTTHPDFIKRITRESQL